MHKQKGGETSWRVDEKWRGRKIKRQVENGRHLYTRWKDKGVKETQAQYGRWYINVQFHCWVNEAMQTLKSRRMLIRPPGQMFLLKNQTVKLTHKTKQSHVCAAFTLQSTFLSYPLLFFCFFFFPPFHKKTRGPCHSQRAGQGSTWLRGIWPAPAFAPLWDKITAKPNPYVSCLQHSRHIFAEVSSRDTPGRKGRLNTRHDESQKSWPRLVEW